MRRQRGHFDLSIVVTVTFWTMIAAGCAGAALLAWGIYANTVAPVGQPLAGLSFIVGGGVLLFLAFAIRAVLS